MFLHPALQRECPTVPERRSLPTWEAGYDNHRPTGTPISVPWEQLPISDSGCGGPDQLLSFWFPVHVKNLTTVCLLGYMWLTKPLAWLQSAARSIKLVSHCLLTSGSPRSAAGGVDCNGSVCEEDGVGTLLREGPGTLTVDMEAGPDPSCMSHLGK